MEKSENLAIITNEKTFKNKDGFFCDNIDMKSIPEGLNNSFNVELFVRKSKKERLSHSINLKNISILNGIISYILDVIKKSKKYKKYLVISITPYTFLISLLLFTLKKEVHIYLRSDGYEEYKCYSRYLGPLTYHIMFSILSWKAKFIACRRHILKSKKGLVVSPSQLNEKWFKDTKIESQKEIKLLYVGRIRPEKGIVSLIKILKKVKLNYNLSIINPEKEFENNIESQNIKVLYFNKKHESLIKIYDEHNIFVLPSFTEGHPQVLDEALSRLIPTIVFSEISHVKRDREGVFISERTPEALSNKIKFIISEYKNIQEKIKTNKLPLKENFLNDMTKIIQNKAL